MAPLSRGDLVSVSVHYHPSSTIQKEAASSGTGHQPDHSIRQRMVNRIGRLMNAVPVLSHPRTGLVSATASLAKVECAGESGLAIVNVPLNIPITDNRPSASPLWLVRKVSYEYDNLRCVSSTLILHVVMTLRVLDLFSFASTQVPVVLICSMSHKGTWFSWCSCRAALVLHSCCTHTALYSRVSGSADDSCYSTPYTVRVL